jgi:hypothetical protein
MLLLGSLLNLVLLLVSLHVALHVVAFFPAVVTVMLLMSPLFWIVADINSAAACTSAVAPSVNDIAADNIAAIVGIPFIPNVLSVAGLPCVVG